MRDKYTQDNIKILNLRKEVGIAIKNKETSIQSAQTRYVAIMHQPAVTISSTMYMHVQIKHSLVHIQDLIPTLAGIKYISDNIGQSRD